VHSNANDKYEYGILLTELDKMSCRGLFFIVLLGNGGSSGLVVERLTIMARFSFGILFGWIIQYVQGRNRHAGFID
jgi:hypothetical protein